MNDIQNKKLTLVTCIGTGAYVQDKNGVKQGYQTTNYRLPNGEITGKINYLGNALYSNLNPEKFVVVGTNGSAWAYLFNKFDKILDTEPELYEYFDGIVDDKQHLTKTDEEHLKQLEDALNREYGEECTFILRMVKDLAEENDQIEIFNTLEKCVEPGDRLILDITHGYRYMPFFAFMTFEFLHLAKGVEIEKILYGTFEKGREVNNVLDLSYMLDLFNWSVAFSKYDSSKDLSEFVDVMKKISDVNTKKVEAMKKFAFFERVMKISQAKQQITEVNSITSEDPVYLTIEEELKQRISWSKKPAAYMQMTELANMYLDSGDFVRSVIYAYEAVRNRCAYEQCIDLNAQKNNENFDKQFKESYKEKYGESFEKLRMVRNSIAHGAKPVPEICKIMENDEELLKFLKIAYKNLKLRYVL